MRYLYTLLGLWGVYLKHLRSARHKMLCAILIEAREAAGLTQRQLAARLHRSQPWVVYIETGQRRVEVLEFIDIARAVRVDPDKLLRKISRSGLAHWQARGHVRAKKRIL